MALSYNLGYHFSASYKASDFCWQTILDFPQHLRMTRLQISDQLTIIFIIIHLTYWQFVTSFPFYRIWIAGHDHPLKVDCLGRLAVHHLADQDLPIQVDPNYRIQVDPFSSSQPVTCYQRAAVVPLQQVHN